MAGHSLYQPATDTASEKIPCDNGFLLGYPSFAGESRKYSPLLPGAGRIATGGFLSIVASFKKSRRWVPDRQSGQLSQGLAILASAAAPEPKSDRSLGKLAPRISGESGMYYNIPSVQA